jgi:pimeloyl-ACP methyl ester carboxylesterase
MEPQPSRLHDPGDLIDVGGYRLWLHQEGQGQPTVILESGWGETSTVWSAVQPAVAQWTHVCSYDRAGLGRSDPTRAPRHSRQLVTDLHTLLDVAGIRPPLILVGHSFGGLNCQLYAKLYPDEVAGLVLVESSHPDQIDRSIACLTSEQWTAYRQLADPVGSGTTTIDDIQESDRQVREAGPLPDIPVIVVTGALRDPDPVPEEWNWPQEEMRAMWFEMQADLVASVPRGKQVMAQCGHDVPRLQPAVVVDAIRELTTGQG